MSLNNYYQRGGSLRADAETYVERTADQELLDGLKAGNYCYVLNARQMGKSSLMFRAKHKLEQQGFACATISLETLGKDYVNHDAWYKGLFTSLVKKFNLVEKFDRDLWWNQQQESPLIKLIHFVEEILLIEIQNTKIVVFFDEIDITLSLHFKVDDFFAFIRACFNRRAENTAYERLRFALFGVASLSELNTNLNIIGREIKLTGFKLSETKPLAKGLTNKVKDTENVLREILSWTGGQPYLTQTICDLVVNSESYIQENEEADKIARIVKTQVIDNWKSKDPQRHLENIQVHLLKDNYTKIKRLTLYQEIWQQGQIIIDETLETHPEKNELQLAGIVVQKGRILQVFNKIYREIFDENWVTKVLANIRPFANKLAIWLKSKEQDESQLLYGQEFREVWSWAAEKHLSQEDNNFLSKSEIFDTVNRERLSNIPNYEFVIKEILSWTKGEKKLNDCIFKIAKKSHRLPTQGSEAAWVDQLVRTQILDNWQKQITNYSIDDFRHQLLIIHLGKLSILTEKEKIDIAEVFEKWIPELDKKTSRLYSSLIEQILLWTKPNPLLVEKICQLICDSSANIPANNEAEYIKELVQAQWIRGWETRADTQPLKDMRDLLLKNQNCDPFRLLIRYRQILRNQVILEDDCPEDTELLNFKIIEKKNGNLSVVNLAYEIIFNNTWIDQSIANFSRPYDTKKLLNWLDSQRKDKLQLLVGEELQKTKVWADNNINLLSQLEKNFITMSFEQDKEEINNYFQNISPELEQKVDRPFEVLDEIISWTYCHKYFTKKIFELILEPSEPYICDGQEEERIENLVQTHLIDNWEFKESSAHLRQIEKAITNSEKSTILLNLYQIILQNDDLPVDDTPEQKELLDSGLIKIKSEKLQVANRIYEQVFNQNWISEKLNIYPSSLENSDDADDRKASPIARLFGYLSIVLIGTGFIGFLLYLGFQVFKPPKLLQSTQPLPIQSSDFARNVNECRRLSDEIDEALGKREKRSEVINKGLEWKNEKKATLNDQCSSFREYNTKELGLNPPDIDNKFNKLLHQTAQNKIDINELKEAVDLFCKITDKYEKIEQVKNIFKRWESDPSKEDIKNKISQLRPNCPSAQL